MTTKRNLRPSLPREIVIEAAVVCGVPANGIETHNPGGARHRVELRSSYGWATLRGPEYVDLARRIADAIQAKGVLCAFDVLDCNRVCVVFERI